ncbi:[NiFe]-hydrogenase assembly chaperone HybE [Thiolapillus sp.]
MNAEAAGQKLETTFERIHREQMMDLPVVNPALRVEAVGFQEYEGRILGVLITPWLMNLVLFPGQDDDWSNFEIGRKCPWEFPCGVRKFMVNELEGVGICQTHSLFSPMQEFVDQQHAVTIARNQMVELLTAREDGQEPEPDEELLGRVLQGEAPSEGMGGKPPRTAADAVEQQSQDEKTALTRRDFLRGRLQKNA